MNGYNERSDQLMEAIAVRDQRFSRNGIGFRSTPVRPTNATEAASSGNLPPWLKDKDDEKNEDKEKKTKGKVTKESAEPELLRPLDAKKTRPMAESPLKPQRPFRETVEPQREAELTTKNRDKLPDSAFAIPGDRSYPINDLAHARNALSRVAQNGSPAEQRQVRNAVYRKFPQLKPSKKD